MFYIILSYYGQRNMEEFIKMVVSGLFCNRTVITPTYYCTLNMLRRCQYKFCIRIKSLIGLKKI